MSTDASSRPAAEWWRGGTIYHAYVRSFRDSDGDGYGDLGGLSEKAEYLAWLGVSALWLSPIMPSPDQDWGYDVSDYRDVHPELGTLAQLRRLIAVCSGLGIRVILDLVPNHTSDQHPWFIASRSSKSSPYRDYYVWADSKPDGSPPNNWIDDTGEVAWSWDETTQQWYFHNFLYAQPDLNWWSPRVHDEFAQIMAFWFDLGVAGFRIDVANGLYKDAQLRDNPSHPRAHIYDTEVQGRYGLQHVHNFNQPEVHDLYRVWRSRAQAREDVPLLMGETWVARVDELAPYYGDNDELQLALNFPFIFAPFTPEALARVVRESFAAFPEGACAVWATSNHDLPRVASRWAQGDVRKARLAQTVCAMLPGAFVLYYGDEVGMTDSDIPAELHRDPLTAGGLNGQWPRDNARAPLRWDASPEGGFSTGTPWLPVHPETDQNIDSQRREATSTLNLVRALVRLRAEELSDPSARYAEVELHDHLWVFDSGPLRVAANFGDTQIEIDLPGVPLLSSRTGAAPSLGALLAPWEAVVLRRTAVG